MTMTQLWNTTVYAVLPLTWLLVSWISAAWSLSTSPPPPPHKFVILGGTGKIGTAVAAHLSRRQPGCDIVLVGRRDGAVGDQAVQEVRSISNDSSTTLSYQCVNDVWNTQEMTQLFSELQPSCVIHTAGPYADKSPAVLDATIAAKIPAYVDVSDPVPFLEASQQRSEAAAQAGTTALCAAGAFPGMSNVLAMEAASNVDGPIDDVRFNYFTKGLGGSGTINLYITNIGFGEPMIQHDNGQRKYFNELSGKLLGTVDFFIHGKVPEDKQDDNARAKRRVGTQKVFAWPFPEAATVASELSILRSSSAAMGTAPDIWNDMLGLLVNIVPQPWWRSERFSKFMADFSQPLVLATDALMQQISPEDDTGETHAMRVDVTGASGMVSIVQAHDSFRQCVGQSCAEFALDLLEDPLPGVSLPEQRYRNKDDRQRIIDKLTSTPGTFCYTGPISIQKLNDELPVYPTRIRDAVAAAKELSIS